MKHCPSCRTAKQDKEFSKDLRNAGNLHWECRSCGRLRSKKYAKGGDYQARLYFKQHYGDPDKMPKQFEEVREWLNDQSLYT